MKYKIDEETQNVVDFGEMDNSFFLIGLLNEFVNRFQTVGDSFFEEISWKQCFLVICIGFFEQPPTIKQISGVMGCSHQNVKQMLLKLEQAGFLKIVVDEVDKRKQRVILTEKTAAFNEENDKPSAAFMSELFEGIDEKELETTIKTILMLDDRLKQIKSLDVFKVK